MLNRKYRLQKDKDFKKVFRKSMRVETENISFRIAKKQVAGRRSQVENSTDHMLHTTNESRFGFVISNKIDKRASRRNGIKRRMRAAIGENIDNIEKGFDVVILVKKPFCYPYDFGQIKDQILEGLKKSNLLK